MINFNLLPKKDAEKARITRQRNLAVIIVIAVVGGLSALYVAQLGRVALAENRLANEQETLDGLNNEIAALGEFEELRDDHRMSQDVIAATMATEVSLADLIDSVGAATTRNSWYDNWTLVLHPEADRPLGSDVNTVGRLTLAGTDVQQTAPGVRSLVDLLNTVEGLTNVFVTSVTQVGEDTYSNQTGDEVDFQIELDLTEERFTGRYANGLPADLAVFSGIDEDAPVEAAGDDAEAAQ